MIGVSLTETYDTIRSLTHPLVGQKIADNITAQIPLIYLMNKIGHKEYENGGYNYRLPALLELPVAQPYTGLSALDTIEADGVTMAIFNRKQLQVPIVVSGTKMLQNSGSDPTAVVDYIAATIEQAEQGMKAGLAGSSQGILSNLGESDLGVTGLQSIIADSTTTGSVGGLSRATYTAWRHQSQSVAANWNTTGMTVLNTLILSCLRGEEVPGVMVVTLATYANILRTMQALSQFQQPMTAFGELGFPHLQWNGAIIIPDAGVIANRAYLLNLKYMKLLVHKDRDMVIRDFITPGDQDALVGRLYWAGNLVCNCLRAQGVLQGVPDTW